MLQLVFIQLAAMLHLPAFELPTFKRVFADETAQDAFEYLLVVGVVVVAIVVAAMTLPIKTVVGDVSTAITGAFSTATG